MPDTPRIAPSEVLAVGEAMRRAAAAGHAVGGWDDGCVYVGSWRLAPEDWVSEHVHQVRAGRCVECGEVVISG